MANEYFIYTLLAATGVLTVYTDVKEGKIKNIHILYLLIISTILYLVLLAAGKLKISLLMPANIVAGLLLGFLLYLTRMWKAGDAKLFFLYSLILTPSKNSYIIFLPCLSLFASIFLISFIALIPLSLKNIFYQKKIFFNNLFSKKNTILFAKIWLISFCVSFLILPVIYSYFVPSNTIMTLVFILFCYVVYQLLAKIRYVTLFAGVLIICAAVRLLLLPELPAIKEIIIFTKYTAGYSAITILISQIISLEEKNYTRLPFSPFMLTGAILTTTPFLKWVIEMFSRLR